MRRIGKSARADVLVIGTGLLILLFTHRPERLLAQEAEPLAARLEQLVWSSLEEDAIPGAALVVVDSGRIVLSRGFGVADLESARPVDPDSTIFRLGSITKVLTAMAILRLSNQGRISLDAPVRDLVPIHTGNSQPGSEVRIHHLLSHTGGFDQTGLGRHAGSPAERPSLASFVDSHVIPIRPPGSVATYDTYGISLAGRILEEVTGSPYADAMRDLVFEPLEMSRSFIEVPPEYRSQLAVGYGLESNTHVAQPYEWYTTLPASSSDATAADMGRLMLAILEDHARDLDPPAKGTRNLTSDSDAEKGYLPFKNGWWLDRVGESVVLHHGGVMRGFSTQLVLLPNQRAGMFVAYNRDPETGPAPRLRDRLTGAFLDHMLPVEDDDGNSPGAREAPDELAGWWVGTLGCFTCRSGEGWPLRPEHIEAAESGAIRFRGAQWTALDSLTYRRLDSEARLTFSRDSAGRIRYANAGQDGFERLDSDLIRRVSTSMPPGREPEALRSLLEQTVMADERPRAMAALEGRPATVDPSGTYLFQPIGADSPEPMRVEIQPSDEDFEGWGQLRADRPRRPLERVIVGGNEVWLILEVPGGALDIRLVVDGETVTGTISEGLEAIPVEGRYIPPTS